MNLSEDFFLRLDAKLKKDQAMDEANRFIGATDARFPTVGDGDDDAVAEGDE